MVSPSQISVSGPIAGQFVSYSKSCLVIPAVFFFSSRRRHTSLQGDWSSDVCSSDLQFRFADVRGQGSFFPEGVAVGRSEEHTSELQSPCNLVCRLLLEKKKKKTKLRFKTNITSHNRNYY